MAAGGHFDRLACMQWGQGEKKQRGGSVTCTRNVHGPVATAIATASRDAAAAGVEQSQRSDGCFIGCCSGRLGWVSGLSNWDSVLMEVSPPLIASFSAGGSVGVQDSTVAILRVSGSKAVCRARRSDSARGHTRRLRKASMTETRSTACFSIQGDSFLGNHEREGGGG